MRKLSDWLCRISGNRVALILLLTLILFVLLVLPGMSRITTAQGLKAEIPDLSFWYSSQRLYEIAENYGESGRMEYVRMHAGSDIIWPVLYVGFLAISISWIFGRLSVTEEDKCDHSGHLHRVNLIPVAAGVFDLLENIFTSIVMLRYPGKSPISAFIAPFTTMLKWTMVIFSIIGLLTGLVLLIIKLFRSDRRKPAN